MPNIYPVMLSGGLGTRLWPLSRSLFPKQLLSLAGERSLIQQTALRTIGPKFAKPSIICHRDHRVLVTEQMRAIGVEPENIFLEPVGRNTAPAAAVAALTIAEMDPDAVLLLMPADHVIRDQKALLSAVDTAHAVARRGQLVTFGIYPRVPETGYGYIQRGPSLHEDGAFEVSRFVEKPDAEMATQYLRAGDYYWNSGIFVFQARAYLSELEKQQPDIVARCRDAISKGTREANCFHLDPEMFAATRSISIDYAVMERTDKAAVVPIEIGWSDIGSWAALWDISAKDANGNFVKGDVLHLDSRNSYLRSAGPLIAALGVNDLVVVATPDAVLVSSKSTTQDVKKIVERLERERRDLHVIPRIVLQSWGSLERIDHGANFEVTRITVNPGAALQLAAEDQRASHWTVVSGTARITRDRETFLLKENEIYGPTDADHQLENAGGRPLQIIETRVGANRGRRQYAY